MGGGGVYFAKRLAEHSLCNDIDVGVINVFRQIKEQPEALIDPLSDADVSKKSHAFYRDEYRPSSLLDVTIG